jgi:hypothetical protein
VLLYFFLRAAANKYRPLFYDEVIIASLLWMTSLAVSQAREKLLTHELITQQVCLTQVLSLPPPE